jgi:hypothetical protein
MFCEKGNRIHYSKSPFCIYTKVYGLCVGGLYLFPQFSFRVFLTCRFH